MAKNEIELNLETDGSIVIIVNLKETLKIGKDARNNVNALKLYESLKYNLDDTYELKPIDEESYPDQTKDLEALKLMHGLYYDIISDINLINTIDDNLAKDLVTDISA